MKSRQVFLPALAAFALLLTTRMSGQTFTTLHSFTEMPPPSYITNHDGATPLGELVLSGNVMYGTTYQGGNYGQGAIFSVRTDGTDLTNLHSFTAVSLGSTSTNTDGARPRSSLLLSNNALYGTTIGGGMGGGTVFKLGADGSGFTVIHSFAGVSFPAGTNSAGADPEAHLVLAGNTLFGATDQGGSAGNGTLFKVNIDGTGFTSLRVFGAEGDGPKAGLILLGSHLYGTAMFGGSFGNGSLFRISTNGTGFITLYSFTLPDGCYPSGELISVGAKLYGTANIGGAPIGSAGNGVAYVINTNGTGFTALHRFSEYAGPPFLTNSDGAMPHGGLVLAGNTLYGVTGYGGISGNGTMFAVHTNGTGFTNLYNFTPLPASSPYTNSDGALPEAGLVLSGSILYGAASGGGIFQNGTLFSFSFEPQLAINRSAANAILTWPTNVAGFDYTGYTLRFATNLVSPVAWNPNLPTPVIINGKNTVTNPISGTQKFYRLNQ